MAARRRRDAAPGTEKPSRDRRNGGGSRRCGIRNGGARAHHDRTARKTYRGDFRKSRTASSTERREKRLPGNVSFCFEGIEGESLLLHLDFKGIAASSGSACTSGSLDPSHVLLACGLPHEIAHGSLRLTISADNTAEEMDYISAATAEDRFASQIDVPRLG